MLSEQSNKDFTTSVVKAVTAAYQEEIQTLILKQSGLHFDGSHTGLSQLEGFSIAKLGQKIQCLAPHLWYLVRCLLDVVPDHCHTAPAEMMVDENIEMQLADIATAVEGNDEGSEESDDDELDSAKTNERANMEKATTDAEENADGGNSMTSDGDEAQSNEEAENETQPEIKKCHYQKQDHAQCNAALIYIVSTLSVTKV